MNTMNPLDITLSKAVEKYKAGDIDNAQSLFLNILNADAKHPDALYFMGMIDHSAGRYEVAEHRAKDLLMVKQNDGRALNLMGTILMTQGKTGDALEYFERGLKHDKENPMLKVNAAICYIGEGRPEMSVQLCKDAIALNEDYVNAYNILGNAYLGLSDMVNAADIFAKALAKRPDYPDARFNLGVALYELHRYDEAYTCFDTYLLTNPASPHAHSRKADVLLIWNRLDEAGPLYERAIEINGGFAPAYVGRGKIFVRLKKFDEALSNFKRAIELDANNIEALMNTGDTFRKMGNNEAAAAAFKDVLQIDPENAQALFHLAAVDDSETPAKPDGDYVRRLFDEFADTFDESLGNVEYNAPEQLITLAEKHMQEDKLHDIIDLGCGTGLCGEKFKPVAKNMKGIDISPRMLEGASRRGIYDDLEENEILEALVRHQNDFDIAVSADTFPYLGDLESVFLAVTSALRENGMFLFSVETHSGDEDYILGGTARYAHSRGYITELAKRRGLEMIACDDTVYRKEGGSDVPGLIVALKKR